MTNTTTTTEEVTSGQSAIDMRNATIVRRAKEARKVASKLDTADRREAKSLVELVKTYIEAGAIVRAMIDDKSLHAGSYREVAKAAEHTVEEWQAKVDAAERKEKRVGKRVTPQPARLSSYGRALSVFDSMGTRDVDATLALFVERCREQKDTSPTLVLFVKYAAEGFKLGTIAGKAKSAATPAAFSPADVASKLVKTHGMSRADVTAVMNALADIFATLPADVATDAA